MRSSSDNIGSDGIQTCNCVTPHPPPFNSFISMLEYLIVLEFYMFESVTEWNMLQFAK